MTNKSLKTFLLEQPMRVTAQHWARRHAPRYFSYRWVYLGGRNYLRLLLGPVVVDVLVRRRQSYD